MGTGGTDTGQLLGVALVVCFLGGLIAGAIAHSRVPTNGTFLGYFIFGALFPLIGIIVACLARANVAPGWYADPFGQAYWRWHDGRQWTGVVHPPQGQWGPTADYGDG